MRGDRGRPKPKNPLGVDRRLKSALFSAYGLCAARACVDRVSAKLARGSGSTEAVKIRSALIVDLKAL